MFTKIIGKQFSRKPSKSESNEMTMQMAPGIGGMPMPLYASGDRGVASGGNAMNSQSSSTASALGLSGPKITINHVPRNSLSMVVPHPQPVARLVSGKERAPTNILSALANGGTDFIENLPAFRDVPGAERHNLFIKKLSICCHSFYFSDPSKSVREKEIKQQTLLELVDFIQSGSVKLSEAV